MAKRTFVKWSIIEEDDNNDEMDRQIAATQQYVGADLTVEAQMGIYDAVRLVVIPYVNQARTKKGDTPQ